MLQVIDLVALSNRKSLQLFLKTLQRGGPGSETGLRRQRGRRLTLNPLM